MIRGIVIHIWIIPRILLVIGLLPNRPIIILIDASAAASMRQHGNAQEHQSQPEGEVQQHQNDDDPECPGQDAGNFYRHAMPSQPARP